MRVHTRIPYEVGADGYSIRSHGEVIGTAYKLYEIEGQDRSAEELGNAEFIVRACNSHEDLLRECKAMRAILFLQGYPTPFVDAVIAAAGEAA